MCFRFISDICRANATGSHYHRGRAQTDRRSKTWIPSPIFTTDLSLPDQDIPSPPSKRKRAAHPIINTAAHSASSGNPTLSYIHPKPANFFSPSATLFSKYSTSRPEKCNSNLTNSALILKNNSFAPPAPLLLKTQDYISASISNSTWRNYSAALSSFQKFELSTNISNP